MRINESLIETIMVYLQEKLDYDQHMEYAEIINNLPHYIKEKDYDLSTSEPEIKYALKKIEELELIEHDHHQQFTYRKVSDITCEGHRFIYKPSLFGTGV